MTCGRNVYMKNGLGAKRLSEIWLGCETSFKTMRTGAKRLSFLWGVGETSFLSMTELGAKRITKKWCELTMGRKICVPAKQTDKHNRVRPISRKFCEKCLKY